MLLTEKQNNHWAKWLGKDFLADDAFWQDCLQTYYNTNVGLPLQYDTLTIFKVAKKIQCPDNCGDCCKCWKWVPLLAVDIDRIKSAGYSSDSFEITTDKGISIHCDENGRCPFLLSTNKCEIYSIRPQTCYMFPLQQGKQGGQLELRLKCQSALSLARKLITDTIAQGDKILLPDLTVLQKIK